MSLFRTLPGAGTPLLLLHGSGGDAEDLVPLARAVAPSAPLLCARGAVAFEGGFAFFHRFPDRSIDEADLAARTPVLADAVAASGAAPIAVGFSNGAIMAAALLLTRPGLLKGAILFRPLSPFAVDPPADLDGTPVLILDGAKDRRRAPGDGGRLAARLRDRGAAVTHQVLPVGHAITAIDQEIAGAWLAAVG